MKTTYNIDEQLALIKKGCNEIINEEALKQKLINALENNKPLIIKAGFDPTAPDIHLGHTVLINKLKIFQDLGHQVCFLVGDFTARIGDPSGRNVTRQPLSEEQILANAKTYQDQVYKILDPSKTIIKFNSEWLSGMSSVDLIKLAASCTVARMLERDDFHKRYVNEQPIAIHEFLYPLLQGYDSVAMRADIELGGNDQKFNLLMGRELQKHHNMAQQVVLTMPLLEGLDGVRKMSKSYDNYIGINDLPDDMFGKVMSIDDEIMWKYYDLLSFKSSIEIERLKQDVAEGANPRDIKILLGEELVSRFHGQELASKAVHNFHERFAKGKMPEEIEECRLQLTDTSMSSMPLVQLLKLSGLCASTSEAIRMVKQGAVKINGEKVSDNQLLIAVGSDSIYQVGKRKFMRIMLTE
jgi:tyrosyl-tRNA synthetase